MDQYWWTTMLDCIGSSLCWSTVPSPSHPEQSKLCTTTMARSHVLLASSGILLRRQCVRISLSRRNQSCSWSAPRRWLHCCRGYYGRYAKGQAYCALRLCRIFQHQWLVVRRGILACGTPFGSIPIPWVSAFPTASICSSFTDRLQVRRCSSHV